MSMEEWDELRSILINTVETLQVLKGLEADLVNIKWLKSNALFSYPLNDLPDWEHLIYGYRYASCQIVEYAVSKISGSFKQLTGDGEQNERAALLDAGANLAEAAVDVDIVNASKFMKKLSKALNPKYDKYKTQSHVHFNEALLHRQKQKFFAAANLFKEDSIFCKKNIDEEQQHMLPRVQMECCLLMEATIQLFKYIIKPEIKDATSFRRSKSLINKYLKEVAKSQRTTNKFATNETYKERKVVANAIAEILAETSIGVDAGPLRIIQTVQTILKAILHWEGYCIPLSLLVKMGQICVGGFKFQFGKNFSADVKSIVKSEYYDFGHMFCSKTTNIKSVATSIIVCNKVIDTMFGYFAKCKTVQVDSPGDVLKEVQVLIEALSACLSSVDPIIFGKIHNSDTNQAANITEFLQSGLPTDLETQFPKEMKKVNSLFKTNKNKIMTQTNYNKDEHLLLNIMKEKLFLLDLVGIVKEELKTIDSKIIDPNEMLISYESALEENITFLRESNLKRESLIKKFRKVFYPAIDHMKETLDEHFKNNDDLIGKEWRTKLEKFYEHGVEMFGESDCDDDTVNDHCQEYRDFKKTMKLVEGLNLEDLLSDIKSEETAEEVFWNPNIFKGQNGFPPELKPPLSMKITNRS
eukprot:TRINITY_DN183870_c0_g1_i1.p1 TRINITY_DN183870_c0_g1~~TRINITY_DN183870_c0_g1_i1.p1  ORF type:complete len:742 (+),score=144.72 TRINITY_DN183870_c0_g1_i1:307-2226(+)